MNLPPRTAVLRAGPLAAAASALAALAFCADAAMPLTVDTCKTMKTEAMRQQCLRSAVNAPPSVTGKTYSTTDVQPRGPLYYDQSAPQTPVAPITPYLSVNPGGGQAGDSGAAGAPPYAPQPSGRR